MRSPLLKSALLISVLVFASALQAAPGWIGDTLYVPMRAGEGSGFRIVHRGLKSGTQVEILKFEDGSDWAHIRLGDIEGYVESQYLQRSPVAALQLERLEKQHQTLRQQHSEAQQRIQQLTQQLNQLTTEKNQLDKNLADSTRETERLQEVAADPIRLDRANRALNEELSLLKTRYDTLTAENALLRNDNTASMWMVGVGILLFGAFIGWLFKSRSSRNRGGWR